MTLVDTSVWVAHFRRRDADLERMLSEEEALIHPFVIGELACGNLRQRPKTLEWFRLIPSVRVAEPDEVLALIEGKRLYGLGLGWIDVNLLASALVDNCTFWTLDNALRQAAAKAVLRIYPATVH